MTIAVKQLKPEGEHKYNKQQGDFYHCAIVGSIRSVNPIYVLTSFGIYCISVLESFRKFSFSLSLSVTD